MHSGISKITLALDQEDREDPKDYDLGSPRDHSIRNQNNREIFPISKMIWDQKDDKNQAKSRSKDKKITKLQYFVWSTI